MTSDSERTNHPKKPTDLGEEFIKKGMRLITQKSSDKYLNDLDHGGEGGSQTQMP